MTADHAGQTGGEREMCGCGAGGDEASSDHSSWCPLFREYGSADDIAATIRRAQRKLLAAGYQSSDLEWHPPSRPVPVPGQAARDFPASFTAPSTVAREAAVEAAVLALAKRIAEDNGLSKHGWEKAGVEWQDGWMDYARELLSLDEVAALSAAPGQVMCDADDGKPATVAGVLFDGDRDVTANYCDDCADLCERHTDFRPSGRPGQEQP